MGKPILLMRLEGPLQSWGGRSRWDVRDTETEPTKSAIIGLLGCALGYGMGDVRLETELDAGFRFGVRVESPGSILKDYQTVSGFLPTADGRYRHSGISISTSVERLRSDPNATEATILSPRYYLEDAAFLVALEERPGQPDLARRCAEALQHPKWPLFLGRKCCIPTRPIFEEWTDVHDNLEALLKSHRWMWMGARNERRDVAKASQNLWAFVEVDDVIEREPDTAVRQDAVRINPARQYGFRNQRRFRVPLATIAMGEGAQT